MSGVRKGFILIIFFHLYLLVFLVPLFLLPGVRVEKAPIVFKELAISFISASLLSIFMIYSLFFSPLTLPKLSLTNLAMLFFVLFIFSSAFFSKTISYCLKEGRLQILLILIYFLSQVIVKSPEEVRRIKNIALFSALLVAFYGICQYLGWDFLHRVFPFKYEPGEGRVYIFSTIGNPEYLGSYIAALSVLLVPSLLFGSPSAAVFSPHSIVYVFKLLTFLFFLLVIFLTGARGAFIGLIAGCLLIFIIGIKAQRLKLRRVHYLIGGGFFITISLIVVIFSFPNPINFRNAQVLGRFKNMVDIRDDSIKERLLFYSVCAEIIGDYPVIGIGPGRFKVEFYPYIKKLVDEDQKAGMLMTLLDLKNRVPDNAHNDLLQFWVEFGSLGFFAFLLAITAHFGLLLPRLTNPLFPLRLSQLETALAGSLLCLLVNAAFSFPLHSPARATIFWVFFGLSHQLLQLKPRLSDKENEKESS